MSIRWRRRAWQRDTIARELMEARSLLRHPTPISLFRAGTSATLAAVLAKNYNERSSRQALRITRILVRRIPPGCMDMIDMKETP